MAKVYVGDYNTTISVDVGVDVTNADSVKLKVTKPTVSTVEEWAAEANNTAIESVVDGTSRKFDVAGEYKIQPYVVDISGDDSGWTGHGTTCRLIVYVVGT